MKVGDLIRHTKTGWTAVILKLPRSTSDAGMMTVDTRIRQPRALPWYNKYN